MAASDKVLGELHRKVAGALIEQVEGYEETTEKGTVKVRPSPAVLGAAIAFLKNNNVTADPSDNAALKELNEALAARRKRKTPQAVLDDAAEQYAQSMGGMLQ
jgi:hypothetical protein